MTGGTDIMGSVVGMVLSYIEQDLAKGAAEKSLNEFDAAFRNVDPDQLKFKDQLLREKRAVQSGFSTDFKVARDIISQSEAGGMSVASELARTNPALALMTMNQVSSQANTSVNQALGTIATQNMGYTQMLSDLIDKIAQRKLDVDVTKASQRLGMETQIQKDTNENVMGLIGQLTGGIGSIGGLGGSSNTESSNQSLYPSEYQD